MEYRYLGQSGLRVSELCMGTLSFGRQADEASSHDILDRFVESGGNFFDTANSYNGGVSEEILGRWLKMQSREEYVVATKVRFSSGEGSGPNSAGLSRKHILHAVEGSLRRLQVAYIDLYQIHCWDPGTPLHESLQTLDNLVQSGKVRYLGVSNLAAYQLQKALDMSRYRGWERFVCLQPQYSLLERSIEWDLLPLCQEEGVGVTPWSPLRHGWLSGKYGHDTGAPAAGSRVDTVVNQGWREAWDMREDELTWRVLDALWKVAEETSKTPAQVALNWLLRQPGVTSPIIGVRDEQQLEENMGAAGWKLDMNHVEYLAEASASPLPYPYDFISRFGQR